MCSDVDLEVVWGKNTFLDWANLKSAWYKDRVCVQDEIDASLDR